MAFAQIRLALIAGVIIASLSGIATWAHMIKTEATHVAVNQCNVDKLETANKSLAALHKEEQKARLEAEKRASEHLSENAKLGAALNTLQEEFNAVSKPRPDDVAPLFDPSDPWWLRRKPAGSGQGGRAPGANR